MGIRLGTLLTIVGGFSVACTRSEVRSSMPTPRDCPVYFTNFGNGRGGFRVLRQLTGGIDFAVVNSGEGSGHRRAMYLRMAVPTRGEVGVTIPLPVDRRFWIIAHWWSIRLRARAKLRRGRAVVALRTVDGAGRQIELRELGEIHLGSEFKESFWPIVPVPKGWPDGEGRSDRAQLLIRLIDAQGSVGIEGVAIQEVRASKVLGRSWERTGPTVFGGLYWLDPAYVPRGTTHPLLRDTGNKLLVTVGMNQMRVFVVWGRRRRWGVSTEVERGKFDFSRIDRQLREMKHYGIRLGLVTVMGTPKWTHRKTADDLPPHKRRNKRWRRGAWFRPDDWRDYRRFVARLVGHLREHVKHWEVWNEPDSPDFGVATGIETYKEFLRNFYQVAKKVDPECRVLCGRAGRWLPFLLKDGMARYMDGVSIHPYPGREGPARRIITSMRQYQLALRAAGVRLPIHVTELGFGAGYPWPGPGGMRNETIKARMLKRTLPRLARMSPAVYWYAPIMKDRWYGLIKAEPDRYRINPAYYAFGRVTGRLTPTGGPVVARIDAPRGPVSKGQTVFVRLEAENTSNTKQNIRFWPVGFVRALGGTFSSVRAKDWRGVLMPGEKHIAQLMIRPSPGAYGRYPIGLAVITPNGNSLALRDLRIRSIAVTARARASFSEQPKRESALNDLIEPVWSFDESVPYFTWYPHRGTREWVSYVFQRSHRLSGVDVYWLDDTRPRHPLDSLGYHTFRVPRSVRILYLKESRWLPVQHQTAGGLKRNCFNRITFTPVRTKALRLDVTLRARYSGGIYEWRVMGVTAQQGPP